MKGGRYAAIILAAGLSRRMEQFKPLLPLGEGTVAERVAGIFSGKDIDVMLVAGHRRDELRRVFRDKDVAVIDNPDYAQGMFTSVLAGVKNLRPDHRGFFIMPVDIPLVAPATVGLLLETARRNPERVIYPVWDGRRGHPTVVPAGLVPAILAGPGEGGLKAVLDARAELALELPVTDANILFDIDTPEDYGELLERFRRRAAGAD